MDKIEKKLSEQFNYENIVKNLAVYELAYQIALEYMVQLTEFDKQSALEKIEQMQLEVDPERVFYSIIAITRTWENIEKFDKEFYNELKKHACINALEDYIKNDKDLMHPEAFLEEMVTKINLGVFFNDKMNYFFNAELDNVILRWKSIISSNLAQDIRQTAISMFN
jgi:hypothetical protein